MLVSCWFHDGFMMVSLMMVSLMMVSLMMVSLMIVSSDGFTIVS